MSACTAPRCEAGWVRVLPGTIARLAPEPDLPEEDTDEAEAERVRLLAEYHDRRAKAENTWYPCKACNSRAFFMWSGGHWDRDHDRDNCDVCADVVGRRRHRRRRSSTLDAEPVDYTMAGAGEDF